MQISLSATNTRTKCDITASATPDVSYQLQFQKFEPSTGHTKNISPEVRMLFSEVERLVRIMMTFPISSCAAERSFSALRRLKNWLRNSMGQERLNAITLCHVNQKYLDDLDLKLLAIEFAKLSDIRKRIVGSISSWWLTGEPGEESSIKLLSTK